MSEIRREIETLDFRLLDNYNWFFIAILWLVFYLQREIIDFWLSLTFFALLAAYTGTQFYNSIMSGKIKNNEIMTMSFINIFACVPLIYYVKGFENEVWILFIWASIAVSTFKEMRNIFLVLCLFVSVLAFITFFQGRLVSSFQLVILLLKVGMIFFVGLSYAKMQKDHFKKESMLLDINEHLEDKIASRTKRIEDVTSIAILSLAKLTESRDTDTGLHLKRILAYTEIMASTLLEQSKFKHHLNKRYVKELVQSSPLHDIGKVGIPDSILLKKGPLTKEEREKINQHTTIGGNALREAHEQIGGESFLSLAQEVAYCHHEKYDGSGYPKGLKEDEIPLSARIIALVDVYDALRSSRPYKKQLSHQEAMEIITNEMKGAFDPTILETLDNLKDQFCQVADTIT